MQKVKICPHCQAASETGSLYCSLCGASFKRRGSAKKQEETTLPVEAESSPATRAWFGAVLALGFVILVFGGLWFLTNSLRNQAAPQSPASVTVPPLASHPAPEERPAAPVANPFEKSARHKRASPPK